MKKIIIIMMVFFVVSLARAEQGTTKRIQALEERVRVLEEKVKELKTEEKNLRETLLSFIANSVVVGDHQVEKLEAWWGKSKWGSEFFKDLQKKIKEKEKKEGDLK